MLAAYERMAGILKEVEDEKRSEGTHRPSGRLLWWRGVIYVVLSYELDEEEEERKKERIKIKSKSRGRGCLMI